MGGEYQNGHSTWLKVDLLKLTWASFLSNTVEKNDDNQKQFRGFLRELFVISPTKLDKFYDNDVRTCISFLVNTRC